MLLLLGFWIIAGITAKDAAMMHYTVKNSSLCLLVAGTSTYRMAWWKFNENAVVMNGNITPNYREKVDYNPKNHSLCINKLTETDSGTYTFAFFNSNYKESTETHRLMVEEAVPRPVIRMSGPHSNLSAEFCNVTVNCSIQDEWLFSVCDKEGCRTSQRSLRKVNLTIFTDNRSIVCRGNNYVSASNESIQAMCLQEPNPGHKETSEQLGVIVIVIIAVCVFLCTFAGYVANRFCSSQYHHNYQLEVSTSRTILSQPAEAPLQSLPRVSPSTPSQAEACYENVGATQPCHTSSPNVSPREQLGSEQSQQVDTVYSFLQVPKGTSSLGQSDGSKGHKEVQEASMSHSVSQDEAQHPAQIDTVYSVLQKPKHKSQHHQ